MESLIDDFPCPVKNTTEAIQIARMAHEHGLNTPEFKDMYVNACEVLALAYIKFVDGNSCD